MEDKLWTPREHVQPNVRKKEGGSQFDDELPRTADVERELVKETRELVRHINSRPDHSVYVGSSEDRDKMRQVLNHMKANGIIGHNPRIKIEYGVAEGSIRVAE